MSNAASLKNRLAAGDTLSALWMDLGSTGVAEVMSEARPDVMIFDMQHGLWDRLSLFNGFAAIRGKCEPLVRVAVNNPVVIGEALDMGAAGVIVPLVETAEQAKAAVAAAKYPPAGNRSAGGTRPLLDFTRYATTANDTVLVSVMIETALGLKNAAAIAAVPGVDLVFIGPGDLSISMGEFPDPGPKHEAAIQTILAACRKAKTPCGLFTFHASFAVERMRQGFQLVLWGNDHDFLMSASKMNAAWFAGSGRKTSLKGAIALVSGTNRGIGPATVKALLAAGAAKVYCGARDTKSIAKLIATSPKKLIAIELDVTKPEQVAKAAKTCSDVNLLVNNAGVNFNTPLIGHDGIENARREMEVNYFGTLAMCRAFAPVLKKSKAGDSKGGASKGGAPKGGAIVNMLSILAHVNLPLMGSLCASKAALLSLTQALRAELASQGTHVMAVLPGAVDTDMTAGLTIPKMKPGEVADSIVHGLEYGLEEVYPGGMAMGLAAGLAQDRRAVEKQFAGFLPPPK